MNVFKPEVKNRLIQEFGYSDFGADRIIRRIASMEPRFFELFAKWWETGKIPTIEIEGFTVNKLMTEHGCNPIAAILNLDGFSRMPQWAKEMSKGHDTIRLDDTNEKLDEIKK